MSPHTTAAHVRRRRIGALPAAVPTGAGAWDRRAAGATVTILYLIASLLIWTPLLLAGIGSVVHTGGDTYLNLNLLGWVPRSISHLKNPFFDPLLNHPGGLNLLVNTSQPLLGILLWPVTALVGPAVSLNLLVLASMPTAALGSYALMRQFVGWRPAAFAGGAIVGFGPYEFQSAAHFHLQLSVTCLIPLLMVVLVWVARAQVTPLRGGLMLGVLMVAQFLVSTELLATAMLVASGAALVTLVVSPLARAHLGGTWRAGGIAALASGVVLVWPIWFLMRGPGSIRGPVQLVAQAYRSDLLALILPPPGLALAPRSLSHLTKGFSTLPGENVAYLGLPLLLGVLAVVAWRWRERTVIIAGFMALVTFLLGLGGALAVTGKPGIGPDGGATGGLWLPESLLGRLPMVKNLIPSRFALYTAIFVAIVAAIGSTRLRSVLRPGRIRTVLPVLLLVVCMAPLVPLDPLHKPFHRLSTIPTYFSSTAFRAHPAGSAMVIFPYPADPQPVAILWQAQSGYRFAMPSGHAKMPEGADHHVAYNSQMGYATNSATGQFGAALNRGRVPVMTGANRRAIRAELVGWKTTALSASLDWIKRPEQADAELRWLLGPPTGHVGHTLYWDAPFRSSSRR